MGAFRMLNRGLVDQANRNQKSGGRPNKVIAARQEAARQQAKTAADNLRRELTTLRAQLVKDQPTLAPPTEVVEEAPRVPVNPNRPTAIEEMVGQESLLTQLRVLIAGSMVRDVPMPHCLLVGPAGHGKSTICKIIASELNATLQETSGVVLRRPQDLAGILIKMEPNTVLMVDECHALPTAVMEMLYEALEDQKISVIAGGGGDAVTQTFPLPQFVCVGATTRPGLLTTPMRERFGFIGTVEQYNAEELAEIVARSWKRRGVEFHEGEPMEVAKRCKLVPRLGLHLSERVLDYAAVRGEKGIPEGTTDVALATFGIDEQGLTVNDWRILEALCDRFAGRPVGISALAQALDMDERTLKDQYEGGLVQAGFMQRTGSGRMALPAAHDLFRRNQS